MVGGSAAVLLSGCTAARSGSTYVDADIDNSTLDRTDGSSRSAEEMSAAAAVAETEPNSSAGPVESLSLERHEFVVQDGYKGPTVRGTVTNTSDERIRYAEVRIRVFDDSGTYLGQYLDSVNDIEAGVSWQFEAVLLKSLDSIGDYDIGVFGIPD